VVAAAVVAAVAVAAAAAAAAAAEGEEGVAGGRIRLLPYRLPYSQQLRRGQPSHCGFAPQSTAPWVIMYTWAR